jgi:hypothetical protein
MKVSWNPKGGVCSISAITAMENYDPPKSDEYFLSLLLWRNSESNEEKDEKIPEIPSEEELSDQEVALEDGKEEITDDVPPPPPIPEVYRVPIFSGTLVAASSSLRHVEPPEAKPIISTMDELEVASQGINVK